MRFRKGFVTNSSSSSFICDVCGHDESGWDMCLSDAEMYECVNGHTFCEDHIDDEMLTESSMRKIVLEIIESDINKWEQHVYDNPDSEHYKQWLQQSKDEYDEYSKLDIGDIDWDDLANDRFELRYHAPKSFCPICSMATLTDSDAVAFLLYKHGYTINDLKKAIKAEFNDYDVFKETVKK